MIKWIIPSMASVVQTAVDRIIRCTLKRHGKLPSGTRITLDAFYLPQELDYLREKEFITRDDVAKIMGHGELEYNAEIFPK